MMRRVILCCLIAVGFFALSAEAQEEGEGRDVTVRTIAVSLYKNHDKLLLWKDGEDLGELSLSLQQVGKSQKIKSRSFFVGFFDGKDFISLGSVDLPKQGNDFILIFIPGESGYSVQVVPGDRSDFSVNGSYILNLTDGDIGVVIGESIQRIGSGKSAMIQPKLTEQKPFFQVQFFYFKEETPILFNNTRWPVSERMRNLIFVYLDGKDKLPTYRNISDLAIGR